MSRWWAVLLCMLLVGCGGATQNVRRATGQQERCVYVPRHDIASGALNGALHSARVGLEVVPAVATLGAAPAAPLAPSSSAPLAGLSGEGLGNGIPRGVLRVVPEGGTAAGEAGATGAAGELIVTGGAIVAATGSVALVCLTVSATVNGEKTPIDIADEYYGTHFGDVTEWVQGQPHVTKAPKTRTELAPAPLDPPGTSLKSEPDKNTKKSRGRIYVAYTKFNKLTHRYYSGRTSMVVDLTKSLEFQAWLAVAIRDMNHHIDEDNEPRDVVFAPPEVDVFDVGAAIDYGARYDDVAYWRIRGREQQLIDSHGGAQSGTGKPYRTENAVRGVAKDNPWGRRFHDAATERWGQRYPYTGY